MEKGEPTPIFLKRFVCDCSSQNQEKKLRTLHIPLISLSRTCRDYIFLPSRTFLPLESGRMREPYPWLLRSIYAPQYRPQAVQSRHTGNGMSRESK